MKSNSLGQKLIYYGQIEAFPQANSLKGTLQTTLVVCSGAIFLTLLYKKLSIVFKIKKRKELTIYCCVIVVLCLLDVICVLCWNMKKVKQYRINMYNWSAWISMSAPSLWELCYIVVGECVCVCIPLYYKECYFSIHPSLYKVLLVATYAQIS